MSTKIKAILWLHALRLWRYKWSFLNMVLTSILWILVFVLGALLFVSPDQLKQAARGAFWALAVWMLLSDVSSLVGGWMNFFISIGMVEEHMLRGTSPFKVLLGRAVPCFSVSLLTVLFMGIVMSEMFKTNVFYTSVPQLVVLGFLIVLVEAFSHGLTIAALSMRTSIPNALLEFVNLITVGLLIVSPTAIPYPLNIVFLALPYTAPMHLIRIGTSTPTQYELFTEALALSLTTMTIIVATALYTTKKSEKWIRINGVKAIGYW